MKRAFEIACAVAAVAVVALYVVVDDDYDLVITTALLGLVAAACVPMVVTNARNAAVPPGLRPQRFEVSPTGFSAPYETDMRLVRTPLLLLFAGFCGLSIGTDNPAFIVITAGLGFALGTSHRQRALVLTPAGITLHTTIFAAPRTLAWGEPLEDPLNLAVNPWFVSAAIQWYAHYPDERPGIGTPAGHDRLREALTAEDPVLPPRPPLPRELVYATWLAYIAVALGVLAGARDLALTTAFLPALRRANEHGLPLGDADLTLLAAVGGFVMAVAGALLAIGLLNAVRLGSNDRARVGLAMLSVAAIVLWLPRPLGGFTLRYADIDHRTGVLILAGWWAVRLVIAGLGLATLVLLMSKPVQEFSRPRVSEGPYGPPVQM